MAAKLLKLHRWIAIAFALPLVFVLATGLILSFEPWLVNRAIAPGRVTAERIATLLATHDAKGEARAIVHRGYERTLTIGGGRGGGGVVVDVVSGEARPGISAMANLLVTARRMHETLLLDATWLVVASTVAMLALVALGIGMGLPRWSNTLSGWHKSIAWGLLPLVVLSPLTGLFIAMGVTFIPAPPAAPLTGPPVAQQQPAKPMPLLDAVRIVGKSHDLSGLVWIRTQGGTLMARVVEGGEYRTFRVTREGTTAAPRNWPRLWHEGIFAGGWSALLNVITSFALIGLLGRGLTMWAQTTLRRRRRLAERVLAAV